MKQYLFWLLATIILLSNIQDTKAQYYDHALGFRAGTSFEISYKRFIFHEPRYIQQAIEGLLGYHIDEWDKRHNGFVLEALYMIHLDLGFDTGFSAFFGGGAYAGIYTEPARQPYFGGGATTVIGAEYTFTHVPISISIDWKPLFGWPRYPYKSLARGAVTIRYVFPTTFQ